MIFLHLLFKKQKHSKKDVRATIFKILGLPIFQIRYRREEIQYRIFGIVFRKKEIKKHLFN